METTQVTQIPDFRIFRGQNHRQMPKLRKAGLVPANAWQIMLGFLEGKIDRNIYHDSGDAIVYHQDNGSVRLVWDSEELRKLNTESSLSVGSLVLPAGAFESIDGEVFSSDKIRKYSGIAQSKSDVLGNPFWQWLARGDQKLLGEYAEQMLGRVKERYGDDKAMRIYVGDLGLDAPALRQWCLGSADEYDGNAGSYYHLDYSLGRLAGVPETRSVSGPGNQRFPVAPEAPRVEKSRASAPREKLEIVQRHKIAQPSLEEVLNTSREHVLSSSWDAFEAELCKLYQSK